MKKLYLGLTLLIFSCKSTQSLSTIKNEYVKSEQHFYYETDCNCFKQGLRLGELQLSISFNRTDEKNGISAKIRDQQTNEPIYGAKVYNIEIIDDNLKIADILSTSNKNGELFIPAEKSNNLSDGFVIYFLSYKAEYFKKPKGVN